MEYQKSEQHEIAQRIKYSTISNEYYKLPNALNNPISYAEWRMGELTGYAKKEVEGIQFKLKPVLEQSVKNLIKSTRIVVL